MNEEEKDQLIDELEASLHLLITQRDALGEEVKEQAKTIVALQKKLSRIKEVLDGK